MLRVIKHVIKSSYTSGNMLVKLRLQTRQQPLIVGVLFDLEWDKHANKQTSRCNSTENHRTKFHLNVTD